MEKFYNMLRKWYVPTKHAVILPPDAEKMLNQDASQIGTWYEPSVPGYAYMHSLGEKGLITVLFARPLGLSVHVVWILVVCLQL